MLDKMLRIFCKMYVCVHISFFLPNNDIDIKPYEKSMLQVP